MSNKLDPRELRLALTLSAVVATRMLGLFLVLPVFMLLVTDMPGYTPAMAGIALGVYGLTQALLQQPFGRMSDRFGRKRAILLGLVLFMLGSLLAALAESMSALIAARALQGCGAIAGVTLAFAADRTQPARRSTVMAIIGMGIGASFLVSIMISAPLAALLGLKGLFLVTAGLGVVGILLAAGTPGGVPPVEDSLHAPGKIPGIAVLCTSVFLLHALMTGLFVVLPGLLVSGYGLMLAKHWTVYVPTMLISAAGVFPLLRFIAARKLETALLPWAFALLSVPFALFSQNVPILGLAAAATLYFLAFNLLEAMMPSVVSSLASGGSRGQKMGTYTTWQFLGAFAGGAAGGWSLQLAGPEQTMLNAALLSLAWAWVARFLFRTGKAGLRV